MEATFTLFSGKISLLDTPPRPTEDGLWLASTIGRAAQGQYVLDAFAGNGVIGLASLHFGAAHVTAVEKDKALSTLNEKNASLNGRSKRWTNVTGDIATLDTLLTETYDLVLANPPFHAVNAGFDTVDTSKEHAHALPQGALLAWMTQLWQRVVDGGRLTLILHVREIDTVRVFATEQSIPLQEIFLQSSESKPAKRVITILGAPLPHLPETIHTYAKDLREQVLTRGESL